MLTNAPASGAQVASKPPTQRQDQARTLSGAMGVHAACMAVVRMMDGAIPQPSQTFKPAGF